MNDETVRRALARIERSYVEPERIDPARMLESALRHAGQPLEGSLDASIGRPGGLVERLAPALEQALAQVGPESLDRCRAELLTGAVHALDRYSRAVTGPARTRLLDRYTGTARGTRALIGERARHPSAGRGPSLRSSIAAEVGGDGVALLRLARLSKTTPREVERWFASGLRGSRPAGLVLDLRGNKGGSMLAAAAIADRFVRRGMLVEALDRVDRPVPGLTAKVEAGDGEKPDWPVAVLLDGATSSAAELLAAALAWNDRAILVGSRSFGKTAVMKLYHYPRSDLTLRLAVAYMRAAGRRLGEQGIAPDVPVQAGDEAPEVAPLVARRLILEHGRPSRAGWLRAIRDTSLG